MQINVDVDGVLFDFRLAWLALAEQVTGRSYRNAVVHSLKIEQCIDIDPDDEQKVWDLAMVSGFAHTLPPVTGAIDAIKELSTWCDIAFVTSPLKSAPTWAHDRRACLQEFFGDLAKNVISTDYKERVDGDIFIEDQFDHLARWLHQRLRRAALPVLPTVHLPHGILIDYPYNLDDPYMKKLSPRYWTRCKGWDEVLTLVYAKAGRQEPTRGVGA